MKLATWNVNSLKVRLPHLLDWLKLADPDVVALQELKMVDDIFPHAELMQAGYVAATNGQKTYNGVAILARLPLMPEAVSHNLPGFADEQRRVIAATVNGVRVISVYVVNGQEVGSEKYAYKLRFLDALHSYIAAESSRHEKLVVMGDYNIAPAPEDTHDPAVWEGGILCSEPEREGLRALLNLKLVDAFDVAPQRDGRFTWWDYRMAGFARNLGLRIDHILLSPALAAGLQRWRVDLAPRKLERPSDHAPVLVELT